MSKEGTIFDDVFRTILEKMPMLAIPLINEVFHTDYKEDEDFEQYKNEHITAKGKVITDSCLKIKDRLYHIECQSTEDNLIIIRMVEYDFAIALEQAISRMDSRKEIFELRFPNSCVLYLRDTKHENSISMKITLPDGNSFMYEVPVIRLQDYTKDEIFQKKLLLLLPFYVMKYEKEYAMIEKSPEKMETFSKEYMQILTTLNGALPEKVRTLYYRRLLELMRKITDYMLKSYSKLKERMSDVMGGTVLELETDKIYERGIAQGISQGIIQGEERIEQLYICMEKDGRLQDFQKAMKDSEYKEQLFIEYEI